MQPLMTVFLMIAGALQDGNSKEGPAAPDRVEALVRELASEDYACREAATKELLGIGASIRPRLTKARVHRDPEVASRIRLIVRDLAMLPVSREAREPLEEFQGADVEGVQRGLEGLLALDRARVVEDLRICANEGGSILRFRALQLLEVLSLEGGSSSVRFGILVPDPEQRVGVDVPGFELWINRTGETVRLPENSQMAYLAPAEKGARWSHSMVWSGGPCEGCGKSSPVLELKENGFFVRRCPDLLFGESHGWGHGYFVVRGEGERVLHRALRWGATFRSKTFDYEFIESNRVRLRFR